MLNISETIKEYKLIKPGETIGVAVSGGADSMALLHYLHNLTEDMDFDIVVLTVDHSIREEGAYDCAFVQSWCRENGIRCYKFKVDSPSVAKTKGISLEEAARECRYGVFDNFLKKQMADKIALGHHMADQAETILFHLIRGSGTAGLRGIDVIRDNVYIRPMLNTEKASILKYVFDNHIPTVEDETNADTKYKRNFLRNRIMPLLRHEWPSIDKTICNYAKLARQDNEFISKFTSDIFMLSNNRVQIPLNYFVFERPVLSRNIFKALEALKSTKDIENKHIDLIISLATSENGSKIDLPNKVKAIKEYDYIVLIKAEPEKPILTYNFKTGTTIIDEVGKIQVKKTMDLEISNEYQIIDVKKLPKGCVWRNRKIGDEIHKLNNGTKSLKAYFIEKKVPARVRNTVPVLASGNKVFVVANLAISDDVKIDNTTTVAYKITFKEN